MLSFFETSHSEIVTQINTQKVLTDELTQAIVTAAKEFKEMEP